jgi:2-amino-4-hydroxy-6-hydroxymethyldihydropteridine diphosphokinase
MGLYSAARPAQAPVGGIRANPRRVEDVVLGFGSNLGARAALIDAACALLCAQPGLTLSARSALYESAPLGPPQPDYLNAAARVRYEGSLHGLLTLTQHVEALLLRERSLRWGPRTLDIDLLRAARGPVVSARLTLPHPGLAERAFALVPLHDVAPDWVAMTAAERGALAAALRHHPHPLAVCDRHGERVVAADDGDEWLSGLIAAMVEVACTCTEQGLTRVLSAPATLPFSLALAARGTVAQALEGAVRAAFHAGFAVWSGAVTERADGRVRGLFVGSRAEPPPRLRPLTIAVDHAHAPLGGALCARISPA